jgi:AAA15 family ATPase/GTPase
MIPLAFRIRDFRSIVDSGECLLSSDRITVLVGQNEAGKTAILKALRDFDLPPGTKSSTEDIIPDTNLEAHPTVSVLFKFEEDELMSWLFEEKLTIPLAVTEYLAKSGQLWVTRDLLEATYSLEKKIADFWPSTEPVEDESSRKDDELDEEEVLADEADEKAAAEEAADELEAAVAEEVADEHTTELLSIEEFAAQLRFIWPNFVYFDAFEDTLPREVEIQILPKSQPMTAVIEKLPGAVQDFITLSDLSLERIQLLANQDKSLSNYLVLRSPSSTMRIFSSALYFFRVWRRISRTTASADTFSSFAI